MPRSPLDRSSGRGSTTRLPSDSSLRRTAHGQAQQLREVEDRQVVPLAELRLDVLLPHVQVQLAQRAGGGDAVGAGGLGHRQDLAVSSRTMLGVGDGEARAAALGLVRPVDGCGPGGLQQLVHQRGVLGVVEVA